jgi:hypothetical protein
MNNTIQELLKYKKKSTRMDPILKTTRSSSLDLGFDDLHIHYDQLLIPAHNHNKKKLCQVAYPLGRLEEQ